MALTMAMAELIGVFLESLAYGFGILSFTMFRAYLYLGVYLMVFNQCVFVLRMKRSGRGRHLVWTAVSLFILTTIHLAIDILRNMQAFTSNLAVPNYPTIYYQAVDTWQDIVKNMLYTAVTLVSDAFVLYRVFIVWNRNYFVVTIPFLLFLADIGISILWVYSLSHVRPGDDSYAHALSARVKIFYSITLAMNVICTSLIAFKILRIQKGVEPFTTGSRDHLSRAVSVVVESCSLYSASLLVMIATFASGSPAGFIILNPMCPIIGIAFSSVIVRVVSCGDSHHTEQKIPSKRNRWSIRPPNGEQIYSMSTPGGGVQVSLQQTTHTYIGGFPGDVENNLSSTHTQLKYSPFPAVYDRIKSHKSSVWPSTK